MYKELRDIKTVNEIEKFFSANSFTTFFTDEEIKAVQDKNRMKSLGARYLIKKSVIDYFNLGDSYQDIEIVNGKNGKAELIFKDEVQNKIQTKIHISLSHSKNYISTLIVID